MKEELTGAASAAALKSAPPVAFVAGSLGGIDMPWVVGFLTAVYLVAQLGYLLWKWRREARKP